MATVQEIRVQYENSGGADASTEGRFAIVSSQVRQGRGGEFALVELRDPTGALTARAFDDQLVELVGSAAAIDANLRVSTFNNGMSVVIQRASEATLSGDELLRYAGLDVDAHGRGVETVRGWLDSCAGTVWGDVLHECFTDEVWRRFTIAPAAVKMHHAEPGGLVKHVREVGLAGLGLLDSCEREYDREYFLAGVLLHDIGKIDTYTEPPAISYSAGGQLAEHQIFSTFRVGKACARLDVGHSVESRLIHIIEQAHGAYRHAEWQDPLGVEVKALAAADYFSSRLGETERERRAADALRRLEADAQAHPPAPAAAPTEAPGLF